jgi:oligoendopeptidase F
MIRSYLPKDFKVESWESLQPYLTEIKDREIQSGEEFHQWMKDLNELDAVVSEDVAWRYIKMTCDTTDKDIEASYMDFVQNIQPKMAPIQDEINNKLIQSKFKSGFEQESAFHIYFRSISTAVELFREKNIPLKSKMSTLESQFGSISGAMTVTLNGEELTLQQASLKLKENDRSVRKEAYDKISQRRLQDRDKLDELFNELIQIRQEVAENADFDNYRDYKFKSLGRFDYTKEDCFAFHNAIESEVVPLLKKVTAKRKELMKLDSLMPYDTAVDPLGRKPLKPFKEADEMLDKCLKSFQNIDPYFGECLSKMKEMKYLDLGSRIGKAPGGYNYPLQESGVPFIFMNASGSLRDVETMFHEGGHAIHSFLSDNLELTAFKDTPAEIAELASMSMELISMDEWHLFFDDDEELKRAKIEQLEGIISTLPWIATIDAFQHWIYENPKHTNEERTSKWIELSKRFGTGIIDFTDYQGTKESNWQRQLHLYEVPFYYIEYGFAQLGAIAVWKNYLENKEKGISDYKEALKLGYTQSIPNVYKAAGVRFDFSQEYVKSLFDFLKIELSKLEDS